MDWHGKINCTYDNTPKIFARSTAEVAKSLEKKSRLIFKWFSDNQFQGNASKCLLLLSTDLQVHVITAQIKNSLSQKL